MPTIELDKKDVLKLVGKKLSDEELKRDIPMLGTDLEEINDSSIVVEIFPNRPDLLSEQGFARALSSFLGIKKGLRRYTAKDAGYKMIIDKSVKDIRPHTACAVVRGLKLDDKKVDQLIKLQEKLHVTHGRRRKKAAIGIYPLDKISFPISFVADKPERIVFRPLETDHEMTGKEILERHETGKEYAHLLSGMERYPYFIDAEGKILSMPPIINSHTTGRIDEKTKDIFVECSGFDYKVLSRTLNMLLCALSETGGEIYSIDVDNKHLGKRYTLPELEPGKMALNKDYINSRLGLKLNDKEMKDTLEKMGYGVSGKEILVPCYRTDILSQADIAEDVAIGYNFDNFSYEIPKVATTGEEDSLERFKDKVADMLIGLGLMETHTYNITSSEQQTTLMRSSIEPVMLSNSLNEDFDCMRAWGIPSLLDVLKKNKHNDYPQEIFDFTRIFKRGDTSDTGIVENDRLVVALCSSDADFTKAKQVLDVVFRGLGKDYEIKGAENNSFIPGRVARISYDGKGIAYLGEIHPEVLENFELAMPVSMFELNITELFELIKDEL